MMMKYKIGLIILSTCVAVGVGVGVSVAVTNSNSDADEEMAQNKTAKAFISTHVLDTTLGTPGANIPVTLFKLNDFQWTSVSSGLTNADGRYENNLLRTELNLGRYKFHFATDEYFRPQNIESLYPFIEVVFDVKTTAFHYHIPLLLQPHGYTTYRGS